MYSRKNVSFVQGFLPEAIGIERMLVATESEFMTSGSPMQLKIECWRPEI